MANVETRRDEYTFSDKAGATYMNIRPQSTSFMSGGSTTSLFYRDLGARWLTTRSKKGIRHTAVKQKPANALKLSINSPFFGIAKGPYINGWSWCG